MVRPALVVVMIAAAVPMAAQGRQGAPGINLGAPPGPPAAAAPEPPPRSATGRVIIDGADRTGKGIWMSLFPIGAVVHLAPLDQIPFQPWARKLYEDRLSHQLEPHARCKPSGSVRQMQTPYGVEIVELPELQRVYLFDIGGPHSYREVYMDGRSHPHDVLRSAYGHSIGWWDGDTLVVDTIAYNEGFWIDRRGLPGTERLHTIERFTRRLRDTMTYEITIDDPGAYSQPFSGRFDLRLDPDTAMFEYMCQEANYAGGLMLGTLEGVAATTPTIP